MTANPSSWSHRVPILVLAVVGLIVSSYLTSYQLGLLRTVWDPLFGSVSSAHVLHSPLSRMLPVPDAGLGALGYLVDLILTSVGGEERWRTRPAVVLLLGVVVAGMALVSLGLVCYQAFFARTFCTLCLVSAAASLVILPLAWEEVAAAARVKG
ncbi:MAG: vitamin K epoxide reductase family protein [Bacteroidales bacterium]